MYCECVRAGNDGSAFVEALVSRSGDAAEKYEVSVLLCI